MSRDPLCGTVAGVSAIAVWHRVASGAVISEMLVVLPPHAHASAAKMKVVNAPKFIRSGTFLLGCMDSANRVLRSAVGHQELHSDISGDPHVARPVKN